MKKKIILPVLLVLVIIVAVTGFTSTGDVYKNLVKLKTIMDLVEQTYVEDVNGDKMVDDAIAGGTMSKYGIPGFTITMSAPS